MHFQCEMTDPLVTLRLSNQGFFHLCSVTNKIEKFSAIKMYKIDIFSLWERASHTISKN